MISWFPLDLLTNVCKSHPPGLHSRRRRLLLFLISQVHERVFAHACDWSPRQTHDSDSTTSMHHVAFQVVVFHYLLSVGRLVCLRFLCPHPFRFCHLMLRHLLGNNIRNPAERGERDKKDFVSYSPFPVCVCLFSFFHFLTLVFITAHSAAAACVSGVYVCFCVLINVPSFITKTSLCLSSFSLASSHTHTHRHRCRNLFSLGGVFLQDEISCHYLFVIFLSYDLSLNTKMKPKFPSS